MTQGFSPAEFSVALQKLIEYFNAKATPAEPTGPLLSERITTFLGTTPSSLAILKETFPASDLPNLHLAFDHFVSGPDRSAERVGFSGYLAHPGVDLAMVFAAPHMQGTFEGPVQYHSVELAGGERLQCMARGMYFVRDGGSTIVACVRAGDHYMQGLTLEIACPEAEGPGVFMAEIRRLVHEHSVYRGQVISLDGPDVVHFQALPRIDRESIILPASLLDSIERNTLGFARHASRLRAAGRHIKRGLLFHGRQAPARRLPLCTLSRGWRAAR